MIIALTRATPCLVDCALTKNYTTPMTSIFMLPVKITVSTNLVLEQVSLMLASP